MQVLKRFHEPLDNPVSSLSFILLWSYFMVSVAERFRRKIVVLVYAGSNPVRHPITGIVVDSLERDRNSGRGSAGGDIF